MRKGRGPCERRLKWAAPPRNINSGCLRRSERSIKADGNYILEPLAPVNGNVSAEAAEAVNSREAGRFRESLASPSLAVP